MVPEVFRNQPVRISVYTPTVPMTVQKRKETMECAPEDSASNSPDATLPHGLVERLAGHDLLNKAETQSLFANAGSPGRRTCHGGPPRKRTLSDQQQARDESTTETISEPNADRDLRAPTREPVQERTTSSGECTLKEAPLLNRIVPGSQSTNRQPRSINQRDDIRKETGRN